MTYELPMGDVGDAFKNSKIGSELDLLTALERGEIVTQINLSRRVGVAVGLINAWLKRAISKGYVKARQAPYKRYSYYLTPQGFAEKSRLVAEYLHYSLHLFRRARAEYGDIFERLKREGMQRIVVAGSGELLEIAILTALAESVSLTAVLDSHTNKAQRLGVMVIQSLGEVEPIDVVVIAETREPQAAYEDLLKSMRIDRILAPPLLRITPDRSALILSPERAESQS
jgi:DNA-binding MarR family transcriptional regulator